MQIKCHINGQVCDHPIEPDLILTDFLRGLGFLSVKQGCDTSNCGVCTVWVDEKPVLSCAVLAAAIDGKQVTTLEGLQDQARAFGRFLADQGADQCGFCNPGFIMTVLAMEKELDNPSDQEIQHYLSGNLCRCTGYAGHTRAIQHYLAAKRKTPHETGE